MSHFELLVVCVYGHCLKDGVFWWWLKSYVIKRGHFCGYCCDAGEKRYQVLRPIAVFSCLNLKAVWWEAHCVIQVPPQMDLFCPFQLWENKNINLSLFQEWFVLTLSDHWAFDWDLPSVCWWSFGHLPHSEGKGAACLGTVTRQCLWLCWSVCVLRSLSFLNISVQKELWQRMKKRENQVMKEQNWRRTKCSRYCILEVNFNNYYRMSLPLLSSLCLGNSWGNILGNLSP